MCSEDYYEEDYPENVEHFEEEYPENVSHFEEEYPENVAQEYEGEGSLLSNTCVGKKLFCLTRGRENGRRPSYKDLYITLYRIYIFSS